MQVSPIRTAEIWTTGIVNIPMNVSASLLFVCKTGIEKNNVCDSLKHFFIPYTEKFRRDEFLIQTSHLLNPVTLRHLLQYQKTKNLVDGLSFPSKIKRKTEQRYLFFELDTTEQKDLETVLDVYKFANIPVFYHRTMRGWHFLSVKPIADSVWTYWLSKIKYLNPDCPHITIRIKPNKWVNEAEIWKDSRIQNSQNHKDTNTLKSCIDNQDIPLLEQKYMIVHYVQKGEQGDL